MRQPLRKSRHHDLTSLQPLPNLNLTEIIRRGAVLEGGGGIPAVRMRRMCGEPCHRSLLKRTGGDKAELGGVHEAACDGLSPPVTGKAVGKWKWVAGPAVLVRRSDDGMCE